MRAFLWLFDTLVSIYIWLVIARVILELLIQFGIINSRQPLVAQIGEFFYRISEPALAAIRNRLPNLGGIDISPMVLIIGLTFIRYLVFEMVGPLSRSLM